MVGWVVQESIRKNFILVYELLDEMMDYGYAQGTSTEALKAFVYNEPVLVEAAKPNLRSAAAGNRPRGCSYCMHDAAPPPATGSSVAVASAGGRRASAPPALLATRRKEEEAHTLICTRWGGWLAGVAGGTVPRFIRIPSINPKTTPSTSVHKPITIGACKHHHHHRQLPAWPSPCVPACHPSAVVTKLSACMPCGSCVQQRAAGSRRTRSSWTSWSASTCCSAPTATS